MRIGRWIAAPLVVVALSACSDAREPAFDAAAARHDLAAAYAGDHPTARDQRDGDCFARHFLDATDPAGLRAAGVVGPDGRIVAALPPLDRETAGAWADAVLGCVDFARSMARAAAAVSHRRTDVGRVYRCLRSRVSEADQREALVASLSGHLDDPSVSRLSTAQSRCAGA